MCMHMDTFRLVASENSVLRWLAAQVDLTARHHIRETVGPG